MQLERILGVSRYHPFFIFVAYLKCEGVHKPGMGIVDPGGYYIHLDGGGCDKQDKIGLLPPGFQGSLSVSLDVDPIAWEKPMVFRSISRLIKCPKFR